MNDQQQRGEEIPPGENASVENRGGAELSIAILMGAGTSVDMELVPGQAIEVVAGEVAARVVLREGDPADLLVVKPSLPS